MLDVVSSDWQRLPLSTLESKAGVRSHGGDGLFKGNVCLNYIPGWFSSGGALLWQWGLSMEMSASAARLDAVQVRLRCVGTPYASFPLHEKPLETPSASPDP
jgi:hypothetical protein